MSKRKGHTYRELRDLIVDAAYQEVCSSGISALSARAIASRVGYAPGTLYNMFANMDEIVTYLYARVLDFFCNELEVKLSPSLGLDNLFVIAGYYMEFSQKYYHFWHLLFVNKFESKCTLHPWYYARITRLHHLVTPNIACLFPNASNKTIELEKCVFWAAIHGFASLNHSNKLHHVSLQDAKEMLEQTVSRIFPQVHSTIYKICHEGKAA